MTPSCAACAATAPRQSRTWRRRLAHRGAPSCGTSAHCATRALSFIPNRGAAADCSSIRNRSRPRPGSRSPRSLRCSSASHPCGRPGIYRLLASPMQGLPRSRRPCRPTRSGTCAGFWIVSMSGSFHRRWTSPIWRRWSPHCCPRSRQAFLQRQSVAFRYRDAKGAATNRVVEPHALLILPPLWYLVAWDPARADFRHFRMDRISSPWVDEGATFQRRHVPFEDHVRPVSDPSRQTSF